MVSAHSKCISYNDFFVSGDSEKACRESCNDFSLQGRYIYYLFRCMSKTLFGIGTPMKSESFVSDDIVMKILSQIKLSCKFM